MSGAGTACRSLYGPSDDPGRDQGRRPGKARPAGAKARFSVPYGDGRGFPGGGSSGVDLRRRPGKRRFLGAKRRFFAGKARSALSAWCLPRPGTGPPARSGSASPPEAGPCPAGAGRRCGLLLATLPLRSRATGCALARTHGGLLRTPPPMAWLRWLLPSLEPSRCRSSLPRPPGGRPGSKGAGGQLGPGMSISHRKPAPTAASAVTAVRRYLSPGRHRPRCQLVSPGRRDGRRRRGGATAGPASPLGLRTRRPRASHSETAGQPPAFPLLLTPRRRDEARRRTAMRRLRVGSTGLVSSYV